MAKISRLSGVLLVETDGAWFIVGDTKRPCDWAAAGFADPGEIAPLEQHHRPLEVTGSPAHSGLTLVVEAEGEALLKKVWQRLVIHRNGSVSERIWDLITEEGDDAGLTEIPANWVADAPAELWEAARDSVLRC